MCFKNLNRYSLIKKKKKKKKPTQGVRKIRLKASVLNIHTSPLLEIDFTMGLGRGRVCMRHIFLLSYILQRTAPEVRIYYNSQLQWDPLFLLRLKFL